MNPFKLFFDINKIVYWKVGRFFKKSYSWVGNMVNGNIASKERRVLFINGLNAYLEGKDVILPDHEYFNGKDDKTFKFDQSIFQYVDDM